MCGQTPMTGVEYRAGASLSMSAVHRLSATTHTHHEPQCRMFPPHLSRAQISIPFSTLLSQPTRRRQGKTSPHILWLPSFNPAILRMQYSPFFEDKYPRRINLRMVKRHSQDTLFQPSTFSTPFPTHSARVLVW